jgi:hypothetical protein
LSIETIFYSGSCHIYKMRLRIFPFHPPPHPFLLDIGFDRPTRWFVRPHFLFFILNDKEMYDECSSAPRERKKGEKKESCEQWRVQGKILIIKEKKKEKKSRTKREYVGLSHHFPFNLHSYHVPIFFFACAHISEINRRSTVSAVD